VSNSRHPLLGWLLGEQTMTEELIGTITHYFPKPQVGVVKLTAGVKVGDNLRFCGHGADFQQTVASMQLDHVPVQAASPGAEVAIRLDQRVREGTQVFRIIT
jgi:hypothetical protein